MQERDLNKWLMGTVTFSINQSIGFLIDEGLNS